MLQLPVQSSRTDLKHDTARFASKKPHCKTDLINFCSRFSLVLLLILLQIPNKIRRSVQFDDRFAVELCDALKMINLDAPQTALAGDTIKLSCFYSLAAEANSLLDAEQSSPNAKTGVNSDERSRSNPNEQLYNRQADQVLNDMLYAIKWYKEDREFFRFLAQEWPHKQVLPLDGVQVDVHRSDNRSVVLKSVSLQTSGLYKCEVSTDAPNFITKSIERKLSVYSLPNGGPQIRSIAANQQQNSDSNHMPKGSAVRANKLGSVGDQIELQCTAPETKPATQIDWIINETLNLTASVPNNSHGLPMFSTINHRYTKLPTEQLSGAILNQKQLRRLVSPQNRTTKSRNPLDPSLVPSNQHPQTAIPKNSIDQNVYADYEIVGEKATGSGGTSRMIEAIPLMLHSNNIVPSTLNSNVLPTLKFSSQTLDQLLETSTSTLNFTIDHDLMQLLFAADSTRNRGTGSVAEQVDKLRNSASRSKLALDPTTDRFKRLSLGPIVEEPSSSANSLGHTSSPNNTNNLSNDTSPKLMPKTSSVTKRKSGYVRTETGSGSPNRLNLMQSNNKAIIHIKCVARVLNLNMFDEIRVIVQTNKNADKHLDKPMLKPPINNPLASLRKILVEKRNERNSASTIEQSIRFVVVITVLLLMLRKLLDRLPEK